MRALPHLQKIREYCNYVEDHILNVRRAWSIMQRRCSNMHPFYDDHLWAVIDDMIRDHDLSKLSQEEFIPYQRNFYPVDGLTWNPANKGTFDAAWEHHKQNNPHHWENWTARTDEAFPNEMTCHCVCMVCDWMAMGMVFNDTAESYYTKNTAKINLPEWADVFVKEIFDRLRASQD